MVHVLNEKFLFKQLYSIEKRTQWSNEAKERYPQKLPLIIEKEAKCVAVDDLVNPKFLMPNTFTIAEV